jgi:hypothetical protein
MGEMNSSGARMPRLIDKKLRELRALAQMNKKYTNFDAPQKVRSLEE